MLAAGHEAQTEPGLVQHHIGDCQGNDCHQHEPVEFKAADPNQEQVLGMGVGNVGGHVVAAGSGGVHSLNCHGGTGGCQQVHGGAGNGLVRLEADGRHCQQQRENHTEQRADQDGHQNHDRRAHGDRQELHNQSAAQGADDHDALQADVDDAAVLREAAAQCHQKQHRSENQCVL